ncbi:MAG: DUF5719 family protein [Actinobacteria bacterium]|nr:DUF5719 family protein [Actinomycetota bacterium]MCL6104394.1 DUF5719 family protein [Actinomycetota bacterium]
MSSDLSSAAITPRTKIVAIIMAVIVVSGVINALVPSAKNNTLASQLLPEVPEATPPNSLSSSWYCVGEPSSSNTTSVVALANASDAKASGTLITSPGSGKSYPIEVPASSYALIGTSHVTNASEISVSTLLSKGEVAAVQQINGPYGQTVSPCTSTTSRHWYFAGGSTKGGHQLFLSLYNPLPTYTIASVSFVTPKGSYVPAGLQGIAVESQHALAIKISNYIHGYSSVAVNVTTRFGRLAASELQISAVSAPPSGSLASGSMDIGKNWYFPMNENAPGSKEQFYLYNPLSTSDKVKVRIDLVKGEAGPFVVEVPSDSEMVLSPDSNWHLPPSDLYSATFNVKKGPGIIVTRGMTAASPAVYRGQSSLTGAELAYRNWLVPVGSFSGGETELLGIQDPGRKSAKVQLYFLQSGKLKRFKTLNAKPGLPVAVTIPYTHPQSPYGLPIVIHASTPVVVEEDLNETNGAGTSPLIGMPLLQFAKLLRHRRH